MASYINPCADRIRQAVTEFVKLTSPSACIVNFFPFLDRIPGPMPWRKRAEVFRKRESAFYKNIIREAVSGKAAGMNTYGGVSCHIKGYIKSSTQMGG